jgi:hypothetical protein
VDESPIIPMFGPEQWVDSGLCRVTNALLFGACFPAMARARLIRFSDAVFEKDGKQIPYRRVNLARLGARERVSAHVQECGHVLAALAAVDQLRRGGREDDAKV